MTHRFHPKALAEWHEAAAYYMSSREQLGIEFVEAVRAGVLTIIENREVAGVYDPLASIPARPVCLSNRVVYFTDEPADQILIVSIMHTSRDSGYIEKRLD